MELIFQHFWLFCAAWVGIGNAMFFRYRLRSPISEGKIKREEANSFARNTIFWISGPCVALWTIQILFLGSSSPFFMDWAEPYKIVAQGITIGLWIVAITWVWFLGGARKLARICTLCEYQTAIWKYPMAFKIVILLMVLGGALVMLNYESSLSQQR